MDVFVVILAGANLLFVDDRFHAPFQNLTVQISVGKGVHRSTVIDILIHTHAEMLDPGDIAADGFIFLGFGILCDLPDRRRSVGIELVKRLLLQLVVSIQRGLLPVPPGCPRKGVQGKPTGDHRQDNGNNR